MLHASIAKNKKAVVAHSTAPAEAPPVMRGVRVQAKLAVSRPGDCCEREADETASRIMSMPDAQANDAPASTSASAQEPQIHRACAECEEKLQRQADSLEDDIEADESGMPKHESGVARADAPAATDVRVPRDGGAPLDDGVRGFMEQRFRWSFGNVRVHTDSNAAESARALRAHAYTVGEDVYFNAGRYAPSSTAGRTLLAHELTHVVQQSGTQHGLQRLLQRQDAGDTTAPDPGTAPDAATTGPSTAAGGAAAGGAAAGGCSPGSCPQGKQRRVTHNDCATSGPANAANYITNLAVDLAGQTVVGTWSGGTTNTWPCTGWPGHTPTGADVVGTKCSINHTNMHRDGMAWFTGLDSHGMAIGFHDSQRVGPGFHSHGCIRVCCDAARIINANTASNQGSGTTPAATTVMVT